MNEQIMKDSLKSFPASLMPMVIVAEIILSATTSGVKAQQVEKLDAVLASPTINTDRGDGYGFEMRGSIFPKNTKLECGVVQSANRIGRYLLNVRQNKPDGLIATWVITLNDGRSIAWESYSKYELDESGEPLSFSYEGLVLKTGQKVITDFTPQLPDCFSGRLVLFFLNGA